MNVRFGGATAYVNRLAFTAKREVTSAPREASAKAERAELRTSSVVYQWVKMSLGLIKEGYVEKRQAKLAARKAEKQSSK